jgi:hypothetical protein
MKYQLLPRERDSALPDVGEPWRMANDTIVYLRIYDHEGAKALGYTNTSDVHPTKFFSVDLRTGQVMVTSRNSEDIIRLNSDCKFF